MSKFKSKVLEQPAPQPAPAPAPAPQPAPAPAAAPPAAKAIRDSGDPADPGSWEWVPRVVAARFRQLRTERDNARAVVRSLRTEQDAARARRRDAVARLEAIAPSKDSAWFKPRPRPELPPDHPEVVKVKAQIEDADSEIARLGAVEAERSAVMQQLAKTVDAIQDYFSLHLRRLGVVEMYDGPPPPPLGKNETAADAVERCRRRGRELSADRRAVMCAPWHSDHAKARARAEISELAKRGEPGVTKLIEDPNGSIYWRERPFVDTIVAGRLVTTDRADPPAWPTMCWLLRDQLIERIEAEIDAVADDEHSLTVEQRAERIAEIDRDRLSVEREEEHWLVEAVKGGASLQRRPDADVRAVLSLSSNLPNPG